MALCLERYLKGHLTDATWNSIKADWVNQWKDCLDNPRWKPYQVMGAYLDDLDMSVDVLDAQFDWACWEIYKNSGALSELPSPLMVTSSHDSPSALTNPPSLVTDLLTSPEPPPVTHKSNPIMMPPTAADTADSPSLIHVTYTASDPFIVNKFPDLLPPEEPPPVTPTSSPMMTPPSAADTANLHHLIHFGSTDFL